jgi:hypothetical protein
MFVGAIVCHVPQNLGDIVENVPATPTVNFSVNKKGLRLLM